MLYKRCIVSIISTINSNKPWIVSQANLARVYVSRRKKRDKKKHHMYVTRYIDSLLLLSKKKYMEIKITFKISIRDKYRDFSGNQDVPWLKVGYPPSSSKRLFWSHSDHSWPRFTPWYIFYPLSSPFTNRCRNIVLPPNFIFFSCIH